MEYSFLSARGNILKTAKTLRRNELEEICIEEYSFCKNTLLKMDISVAGKRQRRERREAPFNSKRQRRVICQDRAQALSTAALIKKSPERATTFSTAVALSGL
jgi:hypothetical protein